MNHVETIPICSNTLFVYKLDIKEDLTLKFKKEKIIKSTHNQTSTGADGASLMSEDLNILRKYKNLNQEINKAVDVTLKEILKLENINYRITGSWLTKAKPKGFSNSHFHRNSWLSGVYYPKGDPGFNITFYHDHTSTFYTPPTEFNIYNSDNWWFSVKTGDIVLFPSSLVHMVEPKKGDNTRISLSFNIFIKGTIGTNDMLNELIIHG